MKYKFFVVDLVKDVGREVWGKDPNDAKKAFVDYMVANGNKRSDILNAFDEGDFVIVSCGDPINIAQ